MRLVSCLLGLAFVAACDESADGGATKAPTQTIVELRIDPRAEVRAKALQVTIYEDDGTTVANELWVGQVEDVDAASTNLEWPATIPLHPKEGNAGRRFKVEARIFDAEGEEIGRLEASGGYRDGERRYVVASFADACLYRACPSGFTCEPTECDGICVPSRCVEACYESTADNTLGVPEESACTTPPSIDGIFVDPNGGRDEGACTQEAPCDSLDYALGQLPDEGPRIVNLASSTYSDVWLRDNEVPVGSNLTLRAWPGRRQAPVFDGRAVANATFKLDQVDDVTVEGFVITNARGAGIEAFMAQRIQILANAIHGNGEQDDDINHDGGFVCTAGCIENRIVGNLITLNHDSDPEGDDVPAGIKLMQTSYESRANVIVGNTITNNDAQGIHTMSHDITISDNFIQGNETGLDSGGGTDLRLTWNRICGNNKNGAQAFQTSSVIEHNTFAGNGLRGFEFKLDGGGAVTQNVFVDNDDAQLLYDTGNVASTMNIYHPDLPAPSSQFGSTQDGEEDPQLENVDECDLAPKADSPTRKDNEIIGAL